MKKLIFIILISSFYTLSCNKRSSDKIDSDFTWVIPVGSIEIKENVYCDRFEITNIDWKEYLNWISLKFGKNSQKYLNALPDTSVWERTLNCLSWAKEDYFSNPKYLYYPVVGINHKQAIDYSNWRSDRVFEMNLVENGIIKLIQINDTTSNIFSIKAYLSGAYNGINPSPIIRKYPLFKLPSQKIWNDLEKLSLSSNNCTFIVESKIQPCDEKGFGQIPLIKANWDCKKHIHFINSNLSELTSDLKVLGKSWNEISTENNSPNAWTGFRNIVEWEYVK